MENKELLELIPFFEELSKADNIYRSVCLDVLLLKLDT
jgi:hypothetical protein